MKKAFLLGILFSLSLFVGAANATTVNLYVDSAPNEFGSPAWPAWETNAKAAAAAGTFVNMQNSVNPANAGTQNFEVQDATVYSFGDLGRGLHFVYWVPGETIANLQSKNFEVAMLYQWDGVWYDYYAENYGQTWLAPLNWEEYNSGVIGMPRFAWWGAYNTNTPAELAADLAYFDAHQGDVEFQYRFNEN
ncbi:MAG: hypothetical protein HGA78_11225, partial [Nitrospirales bacterium]|nr:hypothetical protein [Nitrospirales bacterium]